MKKTLAILLLTLLVAGCGKSDRGEQAGPLDTDPQVTESEAVSLARFVFDKRIHFELADGTGPFWAQFNTDGTHEHSHRGKGTYTVDGLVVSVKDFEHVTLLFSKPTISAGDTFEATVVNDEMGLVFKVLRVEQPSPSQPVESSKESEHEQSTPDPVGTASSAAVSTKTLAGAA